MAFSQQHVLDFSPDGKLFALINNQGVLRIWDTETSELKQEYTPNLQLTGPCSAITWAVVSTAGAPGSEKKAKKARKSEAGTTSELAALYLVLGTNNGKISLYSYALGKIERTLKGEGHSGKVTSVVLDNEGYLYSSGEDCQIIKWSLPAEEQISAWSVGPEKPFSIKYMTHSKNLVVGAHQIEVYSTATHDLVQTFTGHTSEVNHMTSFVLNDSVEYAVTTSRMERIICLWKIGKKGRNKRPACTLLMEDVAHCITSQIDVDGNVRIASVTRSGVIHMHLITVENIKQEKPIKPKLTIEIASDSATVIAPIPAVAASLRHSKRPQELIFAYGDKNFLVFENFTPNFVEKMQVLIRTDPKNLYLSRGKGSNKDGIPGGKLKSVTPIIEDTDAVYKSPSVTLSKKKLKPVELPMESRLENLNLNAPAGKALKAQSKVQLLMQALQSKDAELLRTVLHTHDTKTIELTLETLPVGYVVRLVNELTQYMQKKRLNVEFAAKWLKILVQKHASQLMALGSDELLNIFGPCIGVIEHRLSCQTELSKTIGRLELLITQIKRNTEEDNLNSENVLVYEDHDSSDSEFEDTGDKSVSNDEWDDEEDMEQDDDKNEDDDNEEMET